MIVTELRTEDLPVSERFGFWHDTTAGALIPTAMSCDHRNDFRATLRALDLGAVRVSTMSYPPLETLRTAKLIRRSDPEPHQVVITLRGAHHLAQVGRETTIGPDDLMLHDSSRVFHGRITAETGNTAAAVVAQFPKARFPLPANRVDRLIAVRISGRAEIGALLAQFLVRLPADAAHLRPSETPRLGEHRQDALLHSKALSVKKPDAPGQ